MIVLEVTDRVPEGWRRYTVNICLQQIKFSAQPVRLKLLFTEMSACVSKPAANPVPFFLITSTGGLGPLTPG